MPRDGDQVVGGSIVFRPWSVFGRCNDLSLEGGMVLSETNLPLENGIAMNFVRRGLG